MWFIIVAMNEKVLVISDTHLTSKFGQAKFDFLFELISSFDKVIINGTRCHYGYATYLKIDSAYKKSSSVSISTELNWSMI